MTRETREQRLQSVLHAYLQSVDRGESPNRQAILDAHLDLRDELAEYFADASKLEAMAKSLQTQSFSGERRGVCPPCEPALARIRYFGDYELLEEIARGGMGVVYRAKQVSLNRVVALKMILKGEFAGEADVRRFRQEAEAAANLDHPNIVPIYEVGEHEGQQYFSMKLIELGELGEPGRVSAGSTTPDKTPGAYAARLAKVSRAVHHAHQRGILHRDLKPSNILIDANGEPYVADFGLAKKVEGGEDATKSGVIVGTPAYMAPEQARAEKSFTTAVDVYSLGAILYEWLTGRPPFRGEDALSTLLKVVSDEPAKPRSINGGIDRDLETICLKCLEKDPAKRYGSAAALADDLDCWGRGEPITARRAGRLERTWRWCGRNRLVASAVLLAMIGIGVGAFFAVRNQLAEQVRLRAEVAQANERRGEQLLSEATFARLAGKRSVAIAKLQEAMKIPAENRPNLDSEIFLTLASPTLLHRAQVQVWPVIAPLPDVKLEFSQDSKSVSVDYATTFPNRIDKRKTWTIPALSGETEEKRELFLDPTKPRDIPMPTEAKWFVNLVSRSGLFALLARTPEGKPKEYSLWNTSSKKFEGSFPSGLEPSPFLAISRHGRRVAFHSAYSRGDVQVWDFQENRIVAAFPVGEQQSIGSAEGWGAAGFSPDESMLAVDGRLDEENCLFVFDINTRQIIGAIRNAAVRSEWSPDGRWIASVGGALRSSELEPGATNRLTSARGNLNTLSLSEVVRPVTAWQGAKTIKDFQVRKDGVLADGVPIVFEPFPPPNSRCGISLEQASGMPGPKIGFRDPISGKIQSPYKIDLAIQGRWNLHPNLPKEPAIELAHPGFDEPPFERKDKTTIARPMHFSVNAAGNKLAGSFYLDRREDHPPLKDGLGMKKSGLIGMKAEYSLELWDLDERKRLAIWSRDPSEQFGSVHFVRGGSHVMTTSDQGVKFWDVETGEVVRRLDLGGTPGYWSTAEGDSQKGAVHVYCDIGGVLLSPDRNDVMIRQTSSESEEKPYRFQRYSLTTIHQPGGLQGGIIKTEYYPWALGYCERQSHRPQLVVDAQRSTVRLHDLDTGETLSWDTGREVTGVAFSLYYPGLVIADASGRVQFWHFQAIVREAKALGLSLPEFLTRE